MENCPASISQKYPDNKPKVLEMMPQGGYWRDLPLEIQKEYMQASFYHTGGRTGIVHRLSLKEPSLTLTCSPAQKQTERCFKEVVFRLLAIFQLQLMMPYNKLNALITMKCHF